MKIIIIQTHKDYIVDNLNEEQINNMIKLYDVQYKSTVLRLLEDIKILLEDINRNTKR